MSGKRCTTTAGLCLFSSSFASWALLMIGVTAFADPKHQQSTALPPLSSAVVESLKQQNAHRADRKFQVGIVRTLSPAITVNRQTAPAEKWSLLAGGWRSWTAEVSSPGALGLRLHFE